MKTAFKVGVIRRNKQIKQADLAAKVGISREHLSAVENNRETPSFSLLEKIATVLGVNVTELLDDQSTKLPQL
ncbi:MAG TPA: helix-turn-helix transcriptional regulator [Methylomusa anaerophila]|uniref:HTH-type transcriptional regulator SinR n=1 Tax=Methylomusa anaerophila TaxID=1930071 RepID=A0A348AK39_9FIRM|nr:helix-turn-helix transcriptional regulator [Methylomusa anaerophila]BBB91437.1 HTH-type transcriptional regulator SinR [Methylomusa anaerophila]HML90141.1 helix-turn-helix transcriptional regulator [Methylomusa anaerophila]